MSEYTYLRKPEPYLRKTEPRGAILFDLIRPHLREGDRILDAGCGYSPMATHILEIGHRITGFDINPEPIDHLKQKHTRGEWICTMYEKASFKGYTVLLLLGANDAWNGEDFKDYVLRAVTQNPIRLVLLEMARARAQPRVRGYNSALNVLLEMGYHLVDSGGYESGMDRASTRIFDILERK